MSNDPRSRIWEPLDHSKRQVRLLRLSPSKNRHEKLCRRLEVVSLHHQHPRYDAISHAWGPAQESLELLIDNVRWPITASLAGCLQSFRHETEDQHYWVDAICVNQFDLVERAQQVKLMQHIFYNAVWVRVWLGPGPAIKSRVREAVKLIRRLASKEDRDKVLGQASQLSILPAFTEPEWWERLWVVQEVVLARDIKFYVDRNPLGIDEIKRYQKKTRIWPKRETLLHSSAPGTGMALALSTNRLVQLLESRELLSGIDRKATGQNAVTLVKLMCQCRKARVSDPRDRVYGFLGICTDLFGQEFFEADYTESLGTVYTKFACELIRASRSLAILNQASQFHNSIVGLPSWVPDWSSAYNHDLKRQRCIEEDSTPPFCATNPKTMPDATFDGTGTSMKLRLQGFPFGKVKKISTICEEYYQLQFSFEEDYLEGIAKKWNSDYKAWSRESSFNADHMSFAKTLHRGYKWFDDGYLFFNDLVKVPYTSKTFASNTDRNSAQALKAKERLRSCIPGSVFFISTTGVPGLGPPEMQPGDVLAILHGGDVPYVLRRSEDRNASNLYSLVGECYLHGAMFGEMVPHDPEEMQTIWLE